MKRSSQAHVTTSSTKAGSYTHVWEQNDTAWDAYRYMREFDAFYGPTWAARPATEFVQDVVNGMAK